ncbi:MAG: cell division protein FtsZ [Deltaproteobacteria bacterium]|nr:cell division protein FtsZ [Deltaproteobacteria bacterium]
MFEFEETNDSRALIRIVGIGGAGCNAINTMISAGLIGVDFIAANTDAQALRVNSASTKIQVGGSLTKGLGAGADPDVGKRATVESEDELRGYLAESDMVFVTAGMGGGTGTGGAPVVARIARELGALTVGVVTKPFLFEGKKRMRQADEGLRQLREHVDTLICIPNQRLLAAASRSQPLLEAFHKADEVLLQAVRGISDLITVHGLINLDFADVRTIMASMGMAIMGTATAKGEGRAEEAARHAIASPLLEDISIRGARGVLINITGGASLTLHEVNEAATLIQEEADEEANIIFGAVIDDRIDEEIRITVIATGFGDNEVLQAPPQPATATRPGITPLRTSPRSPANRQKVNMGTVVVDDLDTPAWQRKRPSEAPPATAAPANLDVEDRYDIPAFLRKQAN